MPPQNAPQCMTNTKKRIKIANSLHKLPNELLSKVLIPLSLPNIKNLSKLRGLQHKITSNYVLWHSKCMLSNVSTRRVERSDGYFAAYKQYCRIRRCWMNGHMESRTVFSTNQPDITHVQCNDRYIVVSSDDQSIKIFDVDGNLRRNLVGHFGGVWTFQWHKDVIVSGSTDKSIRVWDFVTGWPLRHLKGHRSTVRCLRVYKDYIVSGARDSTVKVWNMDGVLLHTLRGHGESVRCIDVCHTMLVSGSYDGTVILWDYPKGTMVRRLKSHLLRVYAVLIGRNHIISGGQDTFIHVSDMKGQFVTTLHAHRSIVAWLELTSDPVQRIDHLLVSAGADGHICIWDLRTGTLRSKIVESMPITTIALKNECLFVGVHSRVKVYDLRDAQFKRTLIDNLSSVYKVYCTESRVVVGCKRNTCAEIAVFTYDM
ncbi:Cdc4, F-box and WD-40 protein [Trachipleistophora hominis]|uniref:Cdc4, F-box and WD-40 protein n=1 Tax=Trachipleistophora hominis TaxID=72359 RepID=L7K049_TRAHO|nr:Cdc4, F-box and WD-40 protein [Trachipleistophora hominis]